MRIRPTLRAAWWGAAVALASIAVAGPAEADRHPPSGAGLPGKFRAYQTPYYVLHTDHDIDMVREASVRITCMGEAYYKRCKAFGGKISAKFPFMLFKEATDYYRAGAPFGSAGCYVYTARTGKLMARSDPAVGEDVWRIVQHEGFHQFVHMMMGGEIPIAVNEGLAEYFGHGIWTGDDLVVGVVPPDRLARVQALFKNHKMPSWRNTLGMSHAQWQQGGILHYDQAWAFVHFFVHADEGKYAGRFASMIGAMSKKMRWDQAFVRAFGRDIDGLEDQWREWWLALTPEAGQDLYDHATVQAMTSFLARADMRGRKFENAEAFFTAARQGQLITDPKHATEWNWLPESLLKKTLTNAGRLKEWFFEDTPPARPKLVLTRPDGKVFTGRYRLRTKSRPEVTVTVK